ncbi:MAG TPA: SRPBCC family protein [Acidimicrobiales bacterium]|nr:SRPBCC family protein [Acidimicrobiales bacterium]
MSSIHDLGVLTSEGDQWSLTFTRRFAHAPDKVWRAVTEPEHLAAWFPQRIEGEWKEGATLRFVTDEGDGFDGEVVEFDPPSVLEIMWGTDRLRIEVRADGDGTLLMLRDTFAELGKAARDGAGWHECLAHLARHLDGAPTVKWGAEWLDLFSRYEQALGPEASTLGPPEGWTPDS